MRTRFARTLKEAFPAERFAAITVYPRVPRISGDQAVVAAIVLGIVAVVLMASWGWL